MKLKKLEYIEKGNIFSFTNLPKTKYICLEFKWREDILVFAPLNCGLEFYTEISIDSLVLIHK